jgi:nicotinamidase-related amidase
VSVAGESRLSKLTPENSALLVIDVINSCAHADFEDAERNIHFSKIRQMVPGLSQFIASYRRLGGRVILTTTVPWREPFPAENINELYRESEDARYWSSDESGRAELFYEIPTDGATVFAKNSYDAFTSEELVAALEEMGARYIIIAGIFGDGCVMASVCGAFSRGYRLVIAEDLIETTDDEDRQQLQKLLKERTWPLMYGATVSSQEILAALSSASSV